MTVPQHVSQRFPGAMDEPRFVAEVGAVLQRAGFNRSNTLIAASVCRDELSRSLVRRLADSWGPVFDLSGLAGLPSGGATALGAALGHRPTSGGRSNIVILGLSHVGIEADGTVGKVRRPGMDRSSSTCGSLAAAAGALGGAAGAGGDPLDVEQARVVEQLASRLDGAPVPDLAGLAETALGCIEDTFDALLDRLAAAAGVTRRPGAPGLDGALFTGIQIHHGPEATAVWPSRAVTEVGGQVTTAPFARSSVS